ncbi:MAG: YceI family protein [Gemmatimonadales bacterium]
MIPRRSLAAALAALTLAGAAQGQAGAQTQAPAPAMFKLDASHSSVGFRVRHLGLSWVNGEFRSFTVELDYDRDDPARSRVSARIDAASLDTGHERRDADLKSDRFLGVDSFPAITFETRSVEVAGADSLSVAGDLTVHGVTRPVILGVRINGIRRIGRFERIAFSAATSFDRKDFGITFSPIIEGIRAAGDEVQVSIEIEASRPVDAPAPTD